MVRGKVLPLDTLDTRNLHHVEADHGVVVHDYRVVALDEAHPCRSAQGIIIRHDLTLLWQKKKPQGNPAVQLLARSPSQALMQRSSVQLTTHISCKVEDVVASLHNLLAVLVNPEINQMELITEHLLLHETRTFGT